MVEIQHVRRYVQGMYVSSTTILSQKCVVEGGMLFILLCVGSRVMVAVMVVMLPSTPNQWMGRWIRLGCD